MFNLAVVLDDSARAMPKRDAVVFGNKRLTYGMVNHMANQVAQGLVAAGLLALLF